jgi:predicted TIM-barrel fold metal-dependent hydrolase
MLPALLYERLDELGIDFTIVYPTEGLKIPNIVDDELRGIVCRAYNTCVADQYGPFSDRITPVALIPMFHPAEAIAELEHAVGTLGLKAALFSGCDTMLRPVPKHVREHPDAAGLLTRPDYFGLDSAHDYDPVWAKAQELGVAVTFHAGQTGWGSRQSISNHMYNHIGTVAAGQEPICKAIFLGGVTRRFPDLHFAFLEGGVAWGAALLSDALGHWEKRNVDEIWKLDPARIDDVMLMDLVARFGDDRVRGLTEEIRAMVLRDKRMPRPYDIDDFAAIDVSSEEEFVDLFRNSFWFGCEADDSRNAWAFDTAVNPCGVELQIIFGSDIGHWDVPEMSGVVPEAWETVEDGLLTLENFRDFTFTNAVRLHGGMNPDFFTGTRVEAAAARQLAADAGVTA